MLLFSDENDELTFFFVKKFCFFSLVINMVCLLNNAFLFCLSVVLFSVDFFLSFLLNVIELFNFNL